MLIPVSGKGDADTAENAGTGIGKYANPYTYQIPCYLLAVKWYPATFQ